jgi:hypothetical protein
VDGELHSEVFVPHPIIGNNIMNEGLAKKEVAIQVEGLRGSGERDASISTVGGFPEP